MADVLEIKYGSVARPLRLGLRADGVKQNLNGCTAVIVASGIYELTTTVIPTESGETYPWRVQHEFDETDLIPPGEYRLEVRVTDSDGKPEVWENSRDWPLLRVLPRLPLSSEV